MNKFIGIDLGGTNIKVGLVEPETGSILATKSVPTLAREGHDAVIARMADLVRQFIAEKACDPADLRGIGVGVPGVLDLEKGTTLFLPNLYGTWPHVPLRDQLSNLTGLPVALLNDARAITLGEWKFGAGRGVDTMACFTLGTGVGGGLVINSQLHLGMGGTSGELGHQTVDLNGPRCGCGNIGCLEALASGPAITAMGIKAIVQGRTTILGQMVDYDLNKITPQVISQAAQMGDEEALEIYREVGAYYGIAIANIVVAIGPRKVVLAGGVAAAGEVLFEPVRKSVREHTSVLPTAQVEIVQAELGNNAGVMGVAYWACLKFSE